MSSHNETTTEPGAVGALVGEVVGDEIVVKPKRAHWLLLLIPFIWCVVLAPWANSVGYVFGSVPFLLLWMIGGILIGCAAIAIVYSIDRALGQLEVV